ncbi:MAG: gatA 6 [Chloroflexi bacterium]|nr:gatA 6 [Chloroflexota bacterium]
MGGPRCSTSSIGTCRADAGPMAPEGRFHLLESTIDDVHAAMRAGQISCKQLIQASLDRVEAYDQRGPALNAIQNLNPTALVEAERLDAAFASSGPVGPLHGIPVVVKDQVQTNNMPTTYGSALFKTFVPTWNATVVERLKAAGAVIIGKGNMGEFAAGFAGSAFGVCRNPFDPTRHGSGSSGGVGIAVSANYCTVGIAEDTLGSTRGPSSVSGVVGLRPTTPLVSRYGMMPANPTRDTLGPVARTVRDAALLLDVIAGYDPNDPFTASAYGNVPETYTSFLVADGLKGARLGVIREPMGEDVDPTSDDFKHVRALIDRALADMADGGAEIVDPAAVPGLLDLLKQTAGNFEAEAATERYLALHPNAPVKTLLEIVLSTEVLPSRRIQIARNLGHTTDEPGFARHLAVREELRQAVYQTMADHRLDALVYATFDHEATPIPEDILTSTKNAGQRGSNRTLSTMIGFPALTVPAGYSIHGMPIGLELLGRPWRESLLFKLAYAYELRTHHRKPPPTTPAIAGEP